MENVQHVVLIKLKPDTSEENALKMISGLNGMKEFIPVIQEVKVGKTFSFDRSKD